MSAPTTPIENRRPEPEMAAHAHGSNGDAQAMPAPTAVGGSVPVSTTPPALQLDPRTYLRALSCVHCGLCLPACPTYTETGNEADSPRGRIQLMRGLAEGSIDSTQSVRRHLALCLDCRACETACPSNVVYHELIEETRARFAEKDAHSGAKRSLEDKFLRWMFFNVFTHPTRLKLALLPARLMQRVGLYALLRKTGVMKILPPQIRKMEQMLPPDGKLWPEPLPEYLPASEHWPNPQFDKTPPPELGAYFPGPLGSAMFEGVNRHAVELPGACDSAIIIPRKQGCCGAIHPLRGAHHAAEEMAPHNVDTF